MGCHIDARIRDILKTLIGVRYTSIRNIVQTLKFFDKEQIIINERNLIFISEIINRL